LGFPFRAEDDPLSAVSIGLKQHRRTYGDDVQASNDEKKPGSYLRKEVAIM